jgi:hypothetical protein
MTRKLEQKDIKKRLLGHWVRQPPLLYKPGRPAEAVLIDRERALD